MQQSPTQLKTSPFPKSLGSSEILPEKNYIIKKLCLKKDPKVVPDVKILILDTSVYFIVKIPKMKNKYCRKNAYFETFVFRKLSFGIAVVVPMV